jgi:hypothetical protein
LARVLCNTGPCDSACQGGKQAAAIFPLFITGWVVPACECEWPAGRIPHCSPGDQSGTGLAPLLPSRTPARGPRRSWAFCASLTVVHELCPRTGVTFENVNGENLKCRNDSLQDDTGCFGTRTGRPGYAAAGPARTAVPLPAGCQTRPGCRAGTIARHRTGLRSADLRTRSTPTSSKRRSTGSLQMTAPRQRRLQPSRLRQPVVHPVV